MVVEQAVATHILGRVIQDVQEELNVTGEQKIDLNLVYLRSIMNILHTMAEKEGDLAECEDKRLFVTFSANPYTLDMKDYKHFSLFSLSAQTIHVGTDYGSVDLSIVPGWNKVDAPDGARLTSDVTFNGIALYSQDSYEKAYSASGGGTSGAIYGTDATGSAPTVAPVYTAGFDGTDVRPFLVDTNGRLITSVTNFPATQTVQGTVGVSALPALPAGTNVIGHVIVDSDASGTKQGALTDRSGTITTGGTSQQIMAANANRRYLAIQNNSSGDLWFNFNAASTIGEPSFRLTAGSSFVMESGFISTDSVTIIGATTGQTFTAKEG